MIRLFALCLCLTLTSPVFAQAERSLNLLKGEEKAITPRYLLQDQNGRSITNEDFYGRFQLIAFGYTFCPDICPTTLTEMAAILKSLGENASKLQPIFITLDPERDSAQVLKTYTEFFDPRIMGFTGPPALVQRAAENFKIRFAKVPSKDGNPKNYAVDHGAGMFLLGPDGQFLKKFPFGMPVDQITQQIEKTLTSH